jgi:hypothetical protein
MNGGVGTGSYGKLIEFYIATPGSVRTRMFLKSDGSNTLYGRIYKNGAAVGTERSTTSNVGAFFEEDFSGLVAGDFIQLYVNQTVAVAYEAFLVLGVATPTITAPLIDNIMP